MVFEASRQDPAPLLAADLLLWVFFRAVMQRVALNYRFSGSWIRNFLLVAFWILLGGVLSLCGPLLLVSRQAIRTETCEMYVSKSSRLLRRPFISL